MRTSAGVALALRTGRTARRHAGTRPGILPIRKRIRLLVRPVRHAHGARICTSNGWCTEHARGPGNACAQHDADPRGPAQLQGACRPAARPGKDHRADRPNKLRKVDRPPGVEPAKIGPTNRRHLHAGRGPRIRSLCGHCHQQGRKPGHWNRHRRPPKSPNKKGGRHRSGFFVRRVVWQTAASCPGARHSGCPARSAATTCGRLADRSRVRPGYRVHHYRVRTVDGERLAHIGACRPPVCTCHQRQSCRFSHGPHVQRSVWRRAVFPIHARRVATCALFEGGVVIRTSSGVQ